MAALKELGFDLNEELEEAKSFDDARKRSQLIDEIFFCASLEDIIESKKAAGRQRDKEELPRLELFRKELKKKVFESVL